MEPEELKQQWDILHAKLDEQPIINKELMENAVKGKVKDISSENWTGLIMGLFIIPLLWSMASRDMDEKMIWFGFFIVFCSLLFSIYVTLFFDKVMKKQSIVEREKGLLKYKQINIIRTCTLTVLIVIFLVLYTILVYKTKPHLLILILFYSPILTAFSIWGNRKYMNDIKELQQSISDLKEFEKE